VHTSAKQTEMERAPEMTPHGRHWARTELGSPGLPRAARLEREDGARSRRPA
jgi:hypothetical protein